MTFETSSTAEGAPLPQGLSRTFVVPGSPVTSTICGASRIYTPWITLSIFLSQVLSDDHSCDDAVHRVQKVPRTDHGAPTGHSEDQQLIREAR